MGMYASVIVKQAQAWLGRKESDGSHKEIIDVYNSHKPLARGYKMKYTDAWCSTFASAVAIKCGYTDIIPTECGCEKHTILFKNMGCWIEDESVTPKPGWYVFYNWEDDGKGDTKGAADHIGIVEKVADGKITVIEGNYGNAVKRRTLAVNGRYLRGYGVPKYDPEPTVKIFPVKRSTSKMGFHRCTGNLNLRTGPSTKYKKLELMPKDSIVTSMGEYATNGKTDWLLVAAESGLTGWCSSKWLEKL